MSLKRRVALGQIAGYLFILAGILGHLLLGLPAWGTAVTIMAGFLIIILTLLLALLAIDRASRD